METKNVVVLGASFDSVEVNKVFAEKFKFPYPLLSDTSRAVSMQYGAADDASAGNAKRIAYLIGPDGKVKVVWPKANVSTFAQDAVAQL